MTKVNPNSPIPPSVQHPTYRHASETVRRDNDAGGKVEADQYVGRGPATPQNTPERRQ
jgi:hypothetical protein